MTKYSRSHGGMTLIRDEESIVVAAALTKVKLAYAPIDIFDVGIIGVGSELTAAHYGTDVDEWTGWTTLDDTTDKYAQSFKACHTMVNTVKLYMNTANSFAGTVSVAIHADSTGEPGTIVGTADTKTAAVLSTTKTLETFTFADVTGMTDNDPYWIVISLSAVSAGNVVVYGNDEVSSVYADGLGSNYITDTWTDSTNGDIWFRIDVTEIDVADASISSYVQKLATDAEIVLGAASDDNLIYVATYTTLQDEDLDGYLDTYTAMLVCEHVQNALGSDLRRFYFTLGMLVQKGNIELSHQACRIDPSGGTTAGDTIQNLCVHIDELCVKGA